MANRTLEVTTLDRDGNGLSLWDALQIAHNGDAADSYEITFAKSLNGGTIVAEPHFNGAGYAFGISRNVSIDGDVDGDGFADISIDGGDDLSLFSLSGGYAYALRHLVLENGFSRGAAGSDGDDGADGSDGADGADGTLLSASGKAGGSGTDGADGDDGASGRLAASAIWNYGDLTLEGVTIRDGRALSGDGGAGGRGGSGGTGGDGGDAYPAAFGNGKSGGDGGDGGEGGDGGDAGAAGIAASIVNFSGATLTLNDLALLGNASIGGQHGVAGVSGFLGVYGWGGLGGAAGIGGSDGPDGERGALGTSGAYGMFSADNRTSGGIFNLGTIEDSNGRDVAFRDGGSVANASGQGSAPAGNARTALTESNDPRVALVNATGHADVAVSGVDAIMGVGRADDGAATERGGEVVFRAWRLGDLDEAATVGYRLAIDDGDSAEWKDFRGPKRGVVTFDAGEEVVEFSLKLKNDRFVEGRETFSVELFDAKGAGAVVVGDHGSADGFIIDDEGPTRRNDKFLSSGEAEAFRGGKGSDMVSYAASKHAVIVDLAKGLGAGGDAEGDTYRGLENARGSRGDDRLLGDRLDNDLFGLKGDDALIGGNGKDLLIGGAGDDLIFGGNGKDDLRGDGGRDKLFGGNAKDDIHGGSGDDLIAGGRANDRLWGDAGDDVFKFSKGGGLDRVMDYEDGHDRMKVAVGGFAKLDISQSGDHALVEAGTVRFLVLHTDADDLHAGDFIFS